MIVAIGAVNTPFPVGGQIVKPDALVVRLSDYQVLQHTVISLQLVGRQMFAGGDIAFMVEIEMLPAGQGSPGHQSFNVETKGGIGPAVIGESTPYRAGQQPARLGRQVRKSGADAASLLRQIGQRQTDLLFFDLKCLVGHLAIGLRRQVQNNVGCFDSGIQGRVFLIIPFNRRIGLFQFIVGFLNRPGEPVGADTIGTGAGSEGGKAIVEVDVVSLDNHQAGHGLAGNRLALAFAPVLDLGLSHFSRGIMHQRYGNDLTYRVGQMGFGQLTDFFGQRFKNIPVASRLPAGRHRFLQRVDKGVHIGGVEIILFVPGGGRQDDV